MQSNDYARNTAGDQQLVYFKRNIYKETRKLYANALEYYEHTASVADYPGFKHVIRIQHTASGAAGNLLGEMIVTFKLRFKWMGAY